MNYARYWVRHVIMCLILSVQVMLITLSCIIPANETEIPTFESIYSYDKQYIFLFLRIHIHTSVLRLLFHWVFDISLRIMQYVKKDVKNNQTKQSWQICQKYYKHLSFVTLFNQPYQLQFFVRILNKSHIVW